MGKTRRKSLKKAETINKKCMNLRSQSKAISNNTKVKKSRQKNIKNHIHISNKPNAELNSTSTIETIEINDISIVTDKLGNSKTKSSKEMIPNIKDCNVIDISDTTINDNTDENSQTVFFKDTTTTIVNDYIIDITDTTYNTINYNNKENPQAVSTKETALYGENDEVIDITDDTVIDSDVKSNSPVNSTISFSDDVQIIDYVSQNNPIEYVTISDDSDEEFTQQIKFKSIKERLGIPINTLKNKYNSPLHKNTRMVGDKNTTNHDIFPNNYGAFIIDTQKMSHNLQNNNKFKHKNVKIFQKKNALLASKKTIVTSKRLRPIIIDGLNIGHTHGCGTFSVKGIELCVQYFANRGHQKIIAFIPQHRQGPSGSESNTILNNLYKNGHICFTPSRKVQNLRMTCYDDRIILDYAHQCGGVVVSNDNYRDLYEEKISFKDIIENRQVMVTFVGDEIIVPDDQYNRKFDIRSLSDILCFPE